MKKETVEKEHSRRSDRHVLAVALLAAMTLTCHATNGDNLEGVGAISESMGGVGVAAPQDGITALVNNPAGLAALPTAAANDLVIGLTLFKPNVSTTITTPAGEFTGGSDDPVMLIPFLSYTHPLSDRLTLGIGAYGISGMGVDYRGKGWDLDGDPGNGYEADLFTKLSIAKVSPALAYRLTDSLSAGVALHLNYSTLDLGQGESDDFTFGAIVGLNQQLGAWRWGLSYTSPQRANFKNLYNFDAFLGDKQKDNLKLEQPAIYAAGIAWEPNSDWLLEFNLKRLTWGDSDGYDDFDWKNQWIYAIGAQYRATQDLTLRAGFNYAANPVREHHGWNPAGVTEVQGKQVPTLGYELLRNVGFPAIVESHLTLGFGYQINPRLTLNAAYTHVFEKTINSRSAGDVVTMESRLKERALGVGLSWSFD